MTIISSTVFLLDVLCSFVPYCQLQFAIPEISPPSNDISLRSLDLPFEPREKYPIVHTNTGSLQGYTMTTTNAREIYAFEGIPFGEAPTGERRFRSAFPKKPWHGVRSAMKPGSICIQLHAVKLLRVMGSEDCLFLNIYTPELPRGEKHPKIPVLIQMHGGSYLFGAGSEYGPSYLLDKELIFVTINFRQGIMGFLSTGDMASPGNYGLKDQALAMKWVHENIAAFGGDPDRITIMGQSSGAVSCHLHLISNVSREYFSAAVSLSGSAFLHWGVVKQFRLDAFAKKMAQQLSCPTHPSQAMVDCFRKISPARLVAPHLALWEWFPFPFVFFGPAIEPEHPDAFLTEDPEVIYERDGVAKYPWMTSIMLNEGYAGLYAMNILLRYQSLRRNPEKYIPLLLDFAYLNGTKEQTREYIKKGGDFYFPNKTIHEVSRETFGELGTDRYFATGIEKGIKAHMQVAPVYSYILSYLSQYNIGTIIGQIPEEQGIAHGEDMFFYFNSTHYSTGFRHKDPEYELSQIMINLLSNFAHKREPLYTEGGEDKRIWEKQSHPLKLRFLNLAKEIKMIDDPFHERVQFWESLGLADALPLRSLSKFKKYNR